MSRITLQSKRPAETKLYTFDCISQLASGQTVVSAVTTSTVCSGTDLNPAAMISGSATVTNSRVVNQKITGGLSGVIYDIVVTATLSDATIISICGILAVLPAYT